MTTTTTEPLTSAEQNARGWIETITAAHEAYVFCVEEDQGRYLSREAKAYLKGSGYDGTNHAAVAELIEEHMREAPLSVEIREGWKGPGDGASLEPEQFRILLTTGGPALRIKGELNHHEPSRCWLEAQDWGTPWIRVFTQHEYEHNALRWFVSLFWFGE
jgi:hypothetical protein